MPERAALKVAIDLLHVPSRVRLIRSEPLPDDVELLLRIAAGDEDSERIAMGATGRPPDIIRKAAMFFIEQILFAPDADSYRVLGSARQASPGELRRNVALLLRLLHPDLDPQGERSIFAGRVTAAWNNLKTPERRQAYDEQQLYLQHKTKTILKLRKSRGMRRNGAKPYANPNNAAPQFRFARMRIRPRVQKIGFLRRALAALFQLRIP